MPALKIVKNCACEARFKHPRAVHSPHVCGQPIVYKGKEVGWEEVESK